MWYGFIIIIAYLSTYFILYTLYFICYMLVDTCSFSANIWMLFSFAFFLFIYLFVFLILRSLFVDIALKFLFCIVGFLFLRRFVANFDESRAERGRAELNWYFPCPSGTQFGLVEFGTVRCGADASHACGIFIRFQKLHT